MIDEFILQRAAPATASAAKNAFTTTTNTFRILGVILQSWFTNFRWIEFTTAVSAAFGAGMAMAHSLLLSPPIAYKVALFGAIVGSICYIRSPKTKWDIADADTPTH